MTDWTRISANRQSARLQRRSGPGHSTWANVFQLPFNCVAQARSNLSIAGYFRCHTICIDVNVPRLPTSGIRNDHPSFRSHGRYFAVALTQMQSRLSPSLSASRMCHLPSIRKVIRRLIRAPRLDMSATGPLPMPRMALPSIRLKLLRIHRFLVIDIPGTTGTTVMCYGHLDKHPSDPEWSEGASGYEPVLRDGKLFGRGGVDGGFGPYCYVTAMAVLAEHELPRPRCILFLETTEKSASMYLPRYLPEARKLFDEPSLIILLESICADYDRLWYMQGYRGVVEGNFVRKYPRPNRHIPERRG